MLLINVKMCIDDFLQRNIKFSVLDNPIYKGLDDRLVEN